VTVKTQESKLIPARKGQRVEAGFSVIEMMLVVLVIFIVTAMAMIALQPTWQQFKANAGSAQVKGALRQARELAISDRTEVSVAFAVDAYGDEEVVLNEYVVKNGIMTPSGTPYLTLPIESSVLYQVFPSLPDTPDSFGNKSALYFNGAAYATGTTLLFQSDGTFTDAAGVPINGSIFMGIGTIASTGRAITILGTTGRIKSWASNGIGWFQQ